MIQLKAFKEHPQAVVPQLATESSACFDIHACIPSGTRIKCYSYGSNESRSGESTSNSFMIAPFSRALVPTGLILDIPEGFSVRAHPRSGLAFKHGLTLANAEGVIDEDYVDPIFVMLINMSGVVQQIKHGERIAQLELYKTVPTQILETQERPAQKTSRNGGFGSTGR
jgi:dUTP pyrophosphatase